MKIRINIILPDFSETHIFIDSNLSIESIKIFIIENLKLKIKPSDFVLSIIPYNQNHVFDKIQENDIVYFYKRNNKNLLMYEIINFLQEHKLKILKYKIKKSCCTKSSEFIYNNPECFKLNNLLEKIKE